MNWAGTNKRSKPIDNEKQIKESNKIVKRGSVLESIFGHLKSDNILERNLLKEKKSYHINAILADCEFYLRKLEKVF